FFFFQAEDGIRDFHVTGVQTCALPISLIVQDFPMMELLFALQMTRGSVFPTTPAEVLKRAFRQARLAAVTIGRGFYPTAAALARSEERRVGKEGRCRWGRGQ